MNNKFEVETLLLYVKRGFQDEFRLR